MSNPSFFGLSKLAASPLMLMIAALATRRRGCCRRQWVHGSVLRLGCTGGTRKRRPDGRPNFTGKTKIDKSAKFGLNFFGNPTHSGVNHCLNMLGSYACDETCGVEGWREKASVGGTLLSLGAPGGCFSRRAMLW